MSMAQPDAGSISPPAFSEKGPGDERGRHEQFVTLLRPGVGEVLTSGSG